MNKSTVETCLQLGHIALINHNYTSAIRCFRKANTVCPSAETAAWLNLAEQQQTCDQLPVPQSSSGVESALAASACTTVLTAANFYDILGVAPTASLEDIQRAYKKLILKVHPDKNSTPTASQAFTKVSIAFDLLKDTQKRACYDILLRGPPFQSRQRFAPEKCARWRIRLPHAMVGLVLVASLICAICGPSVPAFSMVRTSAFSQMQETSVLTVTYWVEPTVYQQLTRTEKHILNMSVEEHYLRNLDQLCEASLTAKSKHLTEARRSSDQRLHFVTLDLDLCKVRERQRVHFVKG